MAANRATSILAVDFGGVHTRGVLIDLVEGAYRVVAQAESPTTTGFPWGDVSVGLFRVLDQLEQATGRTFVTDTGRVITPEQPDSSGVDTFLTTASIGRPLRTVLIGLVPMVSIASGLRATLGTYVDVVETITLDDTRDEQTQLNAIVASRPDLIFITGGTEDGARDPVLKMARLAALALPLLSGQIKPSVLYAGNSDLVPDIRKLFDSATLLIAPNVRPSLDKEVLEAAQTQLARAFDVSSAQRGAGFEQVGSMSHLGILPTASGYGLMTDYLSKTRKGGVLAVDIGSSVSILSASLDGRTSNVIRTDLGLGESAAHLLDVVGAAAVQAWIPFEVSADELRTYAVNKTLRPANVPETTREFYLEYGLLRAAGRTLVAATAPLWDASLLDATLPPFSHIIGAGAAFTRTGRPALSAMLLLDALAPTGVTALHADSVALLPALGAAAQVNPLAVVQTLEGRALERLGMSFNVSGAPRAGRVALRIKIVHRGVTIDHELEGGRMWVYPLAAGERARVDVWTKGGLSVGGRKHVKMEVEGGTAGLVFDARGRPLLPAADMQARAAQMPVWMSDASGDAVQRVDDLAQRLDDDGEEAPPTPRVRKERFVEPSRPAPRIPKPGRSGQQDEIDDLRDLFS